MIISRTPYRVSFFGGGTDYPAWYKENGGAVLASTINKYCYITCRYLPPFFENRFRIVYSKIEKIDRISEIQHPSVKACLRYLKVKKGVEIHHDGDLPARTGIGSSSSFTVGLLHALCALMSKMPTKRQLAIDAITIEQDILKENVGSQDQVLAAFGGLNLVEFGGPTHIKVSPITISTKRLELFQEHLMLFFTGLSRTSSEIAAEHIKNIYFNKKRLKTMHNMVKKALQVLTSNADISEFGRLLHENWRIKHSLSNNVSTPDIDGIYADAISAGALGGKLLGAGGGGFMLIFAKPGVQSKIKKRLGKLLHVPFKFDNLGSQIVFYGPNEPIGKF